MTTTLDLNFLNARKVALPNYDMIHIALVGCGGTGSWLAPTLARIARILTREHNKEVHLIFCDGDTIERANVDRQHFCDAEIGRNKADALATRYGTAYGIEIRAIAAPYFQSMMRGGLKLLVGCVDNAKARRDLAHSLYGEGGTDNMYAGLGLTQITQRWWLDCGNDFNSGQVLLGCARDPRMLRDAFLLNKYVTGLPAPDLVQPDLLIDKPEELAGIDLSCANIALRNLQGLSINQHVAAVASNYLVQLLLTEDLKSFATFFHLGAGSQTSLYNTPEHFERVCFPAQPVAAPKPPEKPKGRRHHARQAEQAR